MPSNRADRDPRKDGCYTLLADVNPVQTRVTPRSYPLGIHFDAPFDPDQQTYELEVGDCIRLRVQVFAPTEHELEGLSVARVNLVGWTAARAARDQIFGSCFRSGGDTPDEEILSRGIIQTLEMEHPPPLGADTFYPTEAAELTSRPSIVFDVTVPNRLEMIKEGLFSFLASVTLNGPLGQTNYIIDPEMDVGGGYPP